jgi:hypothetical protein
MQQGTVFVSAEYDHIAQSATIAWRQLDIEARERPRRICRRLVPDDPSQRGVYDEELSCTACHERRRVSHFPSLVSRPTERSAAHAHAVEPGDSHLSRIEKVDAAILRHQILNTT